VRFGPKCPDGFLPVFSTDTEEEAKRLLVLCCDTNLDGEFVARELVMKRDLDSLEAFSDRLQRGWDFLMAADKNRKNKKNRVEEIFGVMKKGAKEKEVEKKKPATLSAGIVGNVMTMNPPVMKKPAMKIFEELQKEIEDACEGLSGEDYDTVLDELEGYIEVCKEARADDRRRG
jgi:hypothetical protein